VDELICQEKQVVENLKDEERLVRLKGEQEGSPENKSL